MPKFEIHAEWSGYSRGTSVYYVEAESAELAVVDYEHGIISEQIKRDDREYVVQSVKEVS
jgi:hypothetical protein